MNGLLTYDRLLKADIAPVKRSNTNVISKNLVITELLPSSEKDGKAWTYTFDKPDSTKWFLPDFNTSGWKSGSAGFGKGKISAGEIRTEWGTQDIWMRQEFTLGNLPEDQEVALYLLHDDDCEIYLNGVKAAELTRHSPVYTFASLSDAAKSALKPNGKNVLAVHCKQDRGDQYIDVGIVALKYVE